MTVLFDCPVDYSDNDCPEVLIDTGDVHEAPPDPPDTTPGDPDTEWEPPVPPAFGRRVQVMLCEPVTHRPLGEVITADMGDATREFGVPSMSFTAATGDPAWELVPLVSTTRMGETVVAPDLKGLEVTVGVDGVRFWSGILHEPQPASGGRWEITAAGGEQQFAERTLGETEQPDLYAGLGSFPTEDLTGWEFSSGIEHRWNTSDPYQGTRSLQVRASGATAGLVSAPQVLLLGHDDITTYPVASALVRIDSDLVMQVMCTVEQLDGTPISQQFTLDERGVSDDGNSDWQIVAGRGRLQPVAVEHNVRAVIVVPAGIGWVDIDLVEIQFPNLTGFHNRQDLSLYPGRIINDASSVALGGSRMGIVAAIRSLTGVLAHLTWAHQDDHPIDEVIGEVRDMNGGPDVWLSPGWRLIVEKRRGIDRRDLTLTESNVLSVEMHYDPAGAIDEYRALTDIGSRSYRKVHAFSRPRRMNRRRIRQLTQTPNGMRFDESYRWAKGQADWAARTPRGATAVVSFDEGLLFNVGDGVRCALADGSGAALFGPVRVQAQRFDFRADTCAITVGLDPVVDL